MSHIWENETRKSMSAGVRGKWVEVDWRRGERWNRLGLDTNANP